MSHQLDSPNKSLDIANITVPSVHKDENRKRQSKRDEAIRRKLENGLSKKLSSNIRKKPSYNRRKCRPGTVLTLNPSEPVICKPTATVYEAAQLMSARRENCILVIEYDDNVDHEGEDFENGSLLGIFTAKDLAFRVVGSGLKSAVITIDQIMTSNPLCATSDTLASEALNLMVEKGFRHLPVIDENTNAVLGVLDITRCYRDAMERLERMYDYSKTLCKAFNSIGDEIGRFSGGEQPFEVLKYFERLKSIIDGPRLGSVLDDEATKPFYVTVKTAVQEAALLMKRNHITAVLVKNEANDVVGIFTSKDIVLRVIAAGLDPKTVSVIRVMTPKPDMADKDITIQEALRKMFEGHYLNLPVVNFGHIIGIAEVLKLTYAALSQIRRISDVELTSHHFQKDSPIAPNNSAKTTSGPAWNRFWNGLDMACDISSLRSEGIFSGTPEISQNELNQFCAEGTTETADSVLLTTGDCLSVTPRIKKDFGTSLQSFKFKTLNNDKIHRISLKPIEGIQKLQALINEKAGCNHDLEISYIDDENDLISLTHDQDLLDCVSVHKNMGLDKIDLLLHEPEKSVSQEEVMKLLAARTTKVRKDRNVRSANPQKEYEPVGYFIPGFCNGVLLPTVVFVLGASLAVLFTLTRKH